MKRPEKITVLITEDHMLVREAWGHLFKDSDGFEIVALCSSGEDAIEIAKKSKPDLIIMDINLPGINGIDATREIVRLLPGSKILGVSLHAKPGYALKMMKAGASAYVTKNSSATEMFSAIDEIFNGKKYLCQEVKNILSENAITGGDSATDLSNLSDRELTIVQFIQKGLSCREIAVELFISVKTVERHRYNIYKKLKVKNTASLVNLVNQCQYLYPFSGN